VRDECIGSEAMYKATNLILFNATLHTRNMSLILVMSQKRLSGEYLRKVERGLRSEEDNLISSCKKVTTEKPSAVR